MGGQAANALRWLLAAALAIGFVLVPSAQGEGQPQSASDVPPSWASWREVLAAYDLDGDGTSEVVELTGKTLRVHDAAASASGDAEGSASSNAFSTHASEDGHEVCETTCGWLVSDCLVGDIDRDGTLELALLVWTRGSYGSSRPFWENDDVDTDTWCQHVYLLRYEEGLLVPLWMSSALEVEVGSVSLDALQRLHTQNISGEELVWAWGSWGLELVDSADEGEDATDQALTLVAVGDNLMHQSIVEGARAEDGTYDFSPVYADVAPWLQGFDVAVVGEEAPLLSEPREAWPVSGAPFSLGDALVDAGFDVVLHASNHVGDFGSQALADELAFWEGAHSEVTQLGIHKSADEPRYAILDRGGMRLALFDYTQSTGRGSELTEEETRLVDTLADKSRLETDLATLEGEVDLSICFVHTGPEGSTLPDEEQLALCERLVDAGADVVVCSHAHEVMPFRRLETAAGNEGVVYYGLGNFVSNTHGEDAVLEAAATLTLRADTSGEGDSSAVVSYGMVPLVCHLDAAGGTSVRLLSTYTEAEAEHNVLLKGEGVDASDLRREWIVRCLSAAEL